MIEYNPILQRLSSVIFSEKELTVDVLRLDLIHPEISGNKWFKLKYNLEEAITLKQDTVLTFGGAFSNHIYATAAACRHKGLKSIGVIRGEASALSNATLSEAVQMGMQLHFVSREEYKMKATTSFLAKLKNRFGDFYLVPEGGNNELGIKGCMEILDEDMNHDYIFCACGTGTTFKGVSEKIKSHQQLIGITVLKGGVLQPGMLNDYHFGGYAKHTTELLEFKSAFEAEFKILLDYVYTTKLIYAVFDLVKKDKFEKGTKILVIHSGGLQGNKGYEKRYNLNPSL
jgi:1-aminocyclopropane-1-carboxylate deaminase